MANSCGAQIAVTGHAAVVEESPPNERTVDAERGNIATTRDQAGAAITVASLEVVCDADRPNVAADGYLAGAATHLATDERTPDRDAGQFAVNKDRPGIETEAANQIAETTGEEWDWVLRDVSFVIEPGETVAIVGHTGAGKTTIISLLLRFYDVQRGAIRVDGLDIREMELTELRRRFGVVLQDPFLFSGTVRDNIKLGTDWIPDERVERAAEDVNVADFIRTLPQGFKEKVHERGSTLSHSAILARELGIPAVVGVPNLLATVRSGERLRLDGANGTIERLEANP